MVPEYFYLPLICQASDNWLSGLTYWAFDCGRVLYGLLLFASQTRCCHWSMVDLPLEEYANFVPTSGWPDYSWLRCSVSITSHILNIFGVFESPHDAFISALLPIIYKTIFYLKIIFPCSVELVHNYFCPFTSSCGSLICCYSWLM